MKIDADHLPRAASSGQPPRDQRPPPGTTGKSAGPNGALFGMTGEERLWLGRAWLLCATLFSAISIVNILTLQHDAPRLGVLRPAIWELSSAFAHLAVTAIPAAVALWMARAKPRWWVSTPANLLAVFVYSALHVSAFVALRKLAYAGFLQETYRFGPLPGEFLYEFRKDMLAYAAAVIICWLALTRGAQKPIEPAAGSPVFDIQDGARLIRVRVADIIAVRSAGNYVEFVLDDGRRPLTRASLGATLEALAPHGFVRTHKSWLVNPARVTGLKPEGSGDYAVELGDLEAPLSRRFPEALAALRG